MDQYLPINHPWLDSSLAPIYRVTFPERASDDALHAYCRAVEKWSTHVHYRVAWVMDLSRVAHVSAAQRASFAKYMEGMKAFDMLYTRATALILPSAMLRGIATAIFWLYPPPFEHQTFSEYGEGLSWIREAMREAPRPAVTLRPS